MAMKMNDFQKRLTLALFVWHGDLPNSMEMVDAYGFIRQISSDKAIKEIACQTGEHCPAGAAFSLAWNFGIKDIKLGESVFAQEVVIASWLGLSVIETLEALTNLQDLGMVKFEKNESHLHLVD